jgi:hypothetical protein
MTRISRFRGWAAIVVIAGLLLPSPAAALVGHFSVGATRGFRVRVTAYGFGVLLRVSRAAPDAARSNANYYLARASHRGEAIDARFGDLGQIKMRFHPTGATSDSARFGSCTGSDRYTFHRGVFVGNFEFRGENGFTQVHASRANGVLVTPPDHLRCAVFPPTALAPAIPLGNPADAFLDVGWRSGLTAQFFSAAGDGHDPARFLASRLETRGALAILRQVISHGTPSDFVTDTALSFATVTPPAPFAGSGELRREESGARTWTGPLAVSFLGAGSTPLTGSSFRTTLTRGFSASP